MSNKVIKQNPKNQKTPPRMYSRFHWTQRIAHFLLLVSFSLLGVTGLVQKYSSVKFSQAFIRLLGGIEIVRLIHHVSAIVLMFLAVYHIVDISYKIFVRRSRLTMLPVFKDIKDAFHAFFYNLGLSKHRPQMGRYTFEEKAEYWALIWGILIMGITGFILWNPITTTRIFPGEIIPAAKAAHGGEAVLAVLAIILWHMYGVHIKRFNKAMFTGKQSEEEMLHEHPLELADIKAGISNKHIKPEILKKRRKIFFPVAGVTAAIFLLGIYGFIGFEKTAITGVADPRIEIPIYVPQSPTPITTDNPEDSEANLTWNGGISDVFQRSCGTCHSSVLATNGLSFSSYNEALEGGDDGKVIIAGNEAGSPLVQIQSAGGHPGQLTIEDLERIKKWISAGAPEE